MRYYGGLLGAPHLKHWSLQSIPWKIQGFYTPSLLKLSFHPDGICDGKERQLWSTTISFLLTVRGPLKGSW